MQRKNIFGKNLTKAITSEDILGKDVIDIEGEFIGVAEKVFIDPASLSFIGISVDKGFIKGGISIGKNYISRITDHAVFLRIRVAYNMKGMRVFDRDGKQVGTISMVDLHGDKNKIKAIHVKTRGIFYAFRKEFVISASHIKSIGENVILSVAKKGLPKYTGQ